MSVISGVSLLLAATAAFHTTVEPLAGEKWWGGALNDGGAMPYETTAAVDLGATGGGTVSSFFVSNRGRYVFSERPFVYAFTNGTMYISSVHERIEPVRAGDTLKSAYLAAAKAHFAFDGRIPAELLFTKPQWNNWIEIAIQGMRQSTVDAYTEALAQSGFPCGVYMMDGGWMLAQGEYSFFPADYPDPKGMFRRIRDHGWKSMIWTAHFVSPDSREFKRLRKGRGYMIDGLDVLAYAREANSACGIGTRSPGVVYWWSGISCVYDLTCRAGFDYFAGHLREFAKEYGIDGFKFDAGDTVRLWNVRFHDSEKEPCDYAREYVRLGAENFEYNEFRSGFNTAGMPVMQRLHDQYHSWEALRIMNLCMQAGGLMGSPYLVADMVGGGDAVTYRPGSYFSEKLFVRSAALQALHPMMQFSAAPWRYLSKENCDLCRAFAELHVEFGPYILGLARKAAKTGEPILRTMEYEFPDQGFARGMQQFMLGPKWLVAPVVDENDAVTVELPAGRWRDDLGETHEGPKHLELTAVPLGRLPRYERMGGQ